jgi:hypothetical protein
MLYASLLSFLTTRSHISLSFDDRAPYYMIFLHPVYHFIRFGSNILSSFLFSGTLRLCSFLVVTGRVDHIFKTGKIAAFTRITYVCTAVFPCGLVFYPLSLQHISTIFKNSVLTRKKTKRVITKINWVTLFEELIAVYDGNLSKHLNTLWAKPKSYGLVKQVVHIVTTALKRFNIGHICNFELWFCYG